MKAKLSCKRRRSFHPIYWCTTHLRPAHLLNFSPFRGAWTCTTWRGRRTLWWFCREKLTRGPEVGWLKGRFLRLKPGWTRRTKASLLQWSSVCFRFVVRKRITPDLPALSTWFVAEVLPRLKELIKHPELMNPKLEQLGIIIRAHFKETPDSRCILFTKTRFVSPHDIRSSHEVL